MSDPGDEEEEGKERYTGRDGIIFLIDATTFMFTEDLSGGCAFRKCLLACENAMIHKIKFSNLDVVGVIFFGTDATCNDGKRSHIYIQQGLQRPSASSVRKLREMHESPTFCDFGTKFGHNEDYLLADALWLAHCMFSKNSVKLTSSRIILLTCSPHPGKADVHSQRQAFACAKDLNGNSIALDLVPCVAAYKPSDFIVKLMKIVDGQNESWSLPKSHAIDSLGDIPKIVEVIASSLDQRSKCSRHTTFRLGEKVVIGVDLYNLVRSGTGPAKIKMNLKTNEEIKSSVVRTVSVVKEEDVEEEDEEDDFSQAPDAGKVTLREECKQPVMKYDLDTCLCIGEERVQFTQVEMKMMKSITEPGLVLLGFVPVSFLKITHHCKPASFLYHGKFSSQGSRDLFTALWLRMGVKEVAAICTFTRQKESRPEFIALVPAGSDKDKEVLGEYRKHGICTFPDPQGFHLFFIPYADYINSLGFPNRPSASPEQVSCAQSVLKKLRFVFHPSLIPNPALETEWAAIETIALGSSSVRMVVDEIMPDYEEIDERLGPLPERFVERVYPTNYDPTAKVTKSSERKTRKVPFSEIHLDAVEGAIKTRQVESFSVDILKGYLKEKGKPVSGKRKADLVEDIYALKYD